MFRLTSNIQIGQWLFDYVVNVDITTDIDTLTDTCTITLPRRQTWDGRKIALGDDPLIKRGDKVIVKLGYDGFLKTRFVGYVKDIKAGVPVQIICEDSMYLLKRGVLTKSFDNSTTLQQLLDGVLPAGTNYKVPNGKPITVGQWRINRASAASVLNELKSKMGLFAYYQLIDEQPVLLVGLAYWVDGRKEEAFRFEYNIISHDLQYVIKDDVKLKVQVNAWQRNNTKVEFTVGDEDGEQRTVHYYGLDAAQCELRARADLERFKYTGYRGSFTTFGVPEVQKGDVANIIGNKYHPDGKYLIKSVRVQFGTGGYRQLIEPESIINDKANSTAVG